MLIVIGDIHACYAELRELLDQIGPGPDDTIVSVGDFVDRGPEPMEVARFLRDTPNAKAILGNHEDKHLRWHSEGLKPALSQRIVCEQAGAAYPELLEYLTTLPLYLELPEAIVVHAAIEPDLPLDQQHRNVLLRCRWPGQKAFTEDPMQWIPRYKGEKPVVYGHVGYPEPRRIGRTFGIDTDACHGGKLTALLLPAERFVSVPSRADHWRRVRSEFGARCGGEMSWKFVESARLDRMAPSLSEKVERARALVEEALDLIAHLSASLPVPDGAVGRAALARALDVHPLRSDLKGILFKTDRRTALLNRFGSPEALEEAVARWKALRP